MPIERCQLLGCRSLVNVAPARSAKAQEEAIPPGSGLPKKSPGKASHACGRSWDVSRVPKIRVKTGANRCKPCPFLRKLASSATTGSFMLVQMFMNRLGCIELLRLEEGGVASLFLGERSLVTHTS